MNNEELYQLRKSLGLTQANLAEKIGLSLKAYNDIERGHAELRDLHVMAVERMALTVAVERGNPMLCPPSVRRDALDLARAITGDESRERERVFVYKYRIWDQQAGDYHMARRPATLKFIKMVGGDAYEGSPMAVDPILIDSNGQLIADVKEGKTDRQLERLLVRFDMVALADNQQPPVPSITQCVETPEFLDQAQVNGLVLVQSGQFAKPIADSCGRSISWTHFVDVSPRRYPTAPAVRYLLGNRR